jgi:hypothetical protein
MPHHQRETVDGWGRSLLLLWTIVGLIAGAVLINGIEKADLVTSLFDVTLRR